MVGLEGTGIRLTFATAKTGMPVFIFNNCRGSSAG